jgi:mRNA interferase MazF
MGMAITVSRFDVVLVALDPTRGSEIKKTRPCLIVSPNEMNDCIRTVIIAPMTTKVHDYASRVPIIFNKKHGEVALDQIRTVDKSRLLKQLGKLDETQARKVINELQELFAW